MADEATPEETPAEEAAPEVAPAPTAESMKADAAKLSKDGIKEAFDADKARMVELSSLKPEEKNGETAAELRMLSQRTEIFKQAFEDLKAAEAIEAPGDLLDAQAEEAPVEEQPPADEAKAEDAPAAPAEGEAAPVDGELVTASAGGAGAPTAPIGDSNVKASLAPFVMPSTNGAQITNLAELGTALQDQVGRNDITWVGGFKPYGSEVTAGVLTGNADENFRTIYGDDTRQMHSVVERATGKAEAHPERTSFTAALNCKGPAEVIQDIPFTYSQGRPLTDSGAISMFEAINGQIQLYSCQELPDYSGILQDAEDCADCNSCPDLTCATHTCIEPQAPMEPNAKITCMCLPESLRFSAPFLLERALEDFAIANDIAYETMWLNQLRGLALNRTIDASAEPEHGAASAIIRALWKVKSRLSINPRENSGGLDNYSVFIPGGEAMFCAAWMDRMSRVVGYEAAGADVLAELDQIVGGNIVFGLDQDQNGPAVAAGYTESWTNNAVGQANAVPLETNVDAGSVYLIPRDSIATASPLRTEMGIDDRDKCEAASGCLKLVRREWWFDLFQVGCRPPIVLDFTGLGTCGTGPDLTVCS